MNKKGFTLAEVLVTLAIIGVVAALTIPSLIQSTNKNKYEVALKKNYSILNQAYMLFKADGVDMASIFTGVDDGATALNNFTEKLNVIKNCGSGTGCWYNTEYKNISGTVLLNNYDTYMNGSAGKAILADGTMLQVNDYLSNCTSTPPFMGASTRLINSVCGFIDIDINGAKGPNQIGRDNFGFWVTKTGLVPFGADNDTYAMTEPCPSDDGYACTVRVLTQGMNY